MLPILDDREWFIGIVGLPLVQTGAFGRREKEYVESETAVVVHGDQLTLGHYFDDTDEWRHIAILEALAESICKSCHRPARIYVKHERHGCWLRAARCLVDVEVIDVPDMDLDALVAANPPWPKREVVIDPQLYIRLHAAAAALRRASASCKLEDDIDFFFDLPTIGLVGSAHFERTKPGLESLLIGRFRVNAHASPDDNLDTIWQPIELFHLPPEQASERLRSVRAPYMSDGEPYPIVECDEDINELHDAAARELRIVCLVAQGLAALMHEHSRALKRRAEVRGEYDGRWGDQVFTVRITRPQRARLGLLSS